MPSFNRLLAAFSLLSVSGSALGIYDPAAKTTKAPNRQEAVVLPWYLSGNYTEQPDDGSRSPKWPISLGEVTTPVTITAGTKNWSEWRKAPGSDLEQRTELSKDPPQTETSGQDRRRNHPNGFDQDRHQPGRYDQDRPGRFDRDRDTPGRYDQDRPGRYDQDRPGRFDGDRRRPGRYDQDSDDRSGRADRHRDPPGRYDQDSDDRSGRADRHRDPPGRYDQDSDDRSGRADRHRDPPGRYDQDYDDRNRPGRGYPGRHDQDEDRRQSDRYNPSRDPSGRFDRHHPGMFDQDHPGDDLRHEDRDCHDSSHQPESNLYEGVPVKPHKENLLFSTKPKPRIARYDPLSGVQCPEADSTGQFVFPPDCKFFVNCWQGRAFVQPCAPGTLFNPETLECDFPHKVNCYGNEFAESPFSHHLEPHGTHGHHLPGARTYDKETLQNPKCPPHVTGLLPHPGDCTKFLQCANGGTFIKDCGPGTVFNTAISVCDWPYNVRGCEDAMKKKDVNAESPLIPPKPNTYDHVTDRTWTSEYSQPQPKKPECPTDYVGLLPHPDTCKKFLQCANGITFVMDCGPGTAFNPETSLCDWPHKVPGCSKDKSKQTPASTTTTWPPRGPGSSGSWHTPPGHRGRDPWSTGPPVITPTAPTYPDNTGHFGHNSHTDHTHDYDNRYPHPHNVPPGHPRWQPSGHRPGHPNHGYDDRTEGGWTRETIPPDGNHSGNGYGDHNHHDIHGHHGHHDPGHSVYGHEHPVHGHEHPGRGHENYPGHHGHHGHPHQYPGPYDIPPQPDYGNRRDNLPSSSNQNPNPWVPAREQPNGQPPSTPWNYPIYTGSGGGQPNVQVTGSPYNRTQPPQPTSSGGFGQPGSPGRPTGVTTGHGNHGGTVGGYSQSGNNNWTSPTNVFNTSTVSAFWPSGNKSVGIPPGHLDPQPEQFAPSSGSPQAPNVNQSQGRQWQQGTVGRDGKSPDWQTWMNVYQQSTSDKDVDSRMDQWASRTNTFQQSKGQVRPGSKSTPQQDPNESVYPHGIYVNVNGTWGHYITKNIEINQGHSKTRTYGRNDIPLNEKNQTRDTNYDFLLPPFEDPVNSSSARGYGRYPLTLTLEPPFPPENKSNSTNYDFLLPPFEDPPSPSSAAGGDHTLTLTLQPPFPSQKQPNFTTYDNQSFASGSQLFPGSSNVTDSNYNHLVLYLQPPLPDDKLSDPGKSSFSSHSNTYHTPHSNRPNPIESDNLSTDSSHLYATYQRPARPIGANYPFPTNQNEFRPSPSYPPNSDGPTYRQGRFNNFNSTKPRTNLPFLIYVIPPSQRSDSRSPTSNSSDSKNHYLLIPYPQPTFPSTNQPVPRSNSSTPYIFILYPRASANRSVDLSLVLPQIPETTAPNARDADRPETTTERAPTKQTKQKKKAPSTTEAPKKSDPPHPDVPEVTIEYDGKDENGKSDAESPVLPPEVVEPDVKKYDVDVLDEKEGWKPRLVFENKTKVTTTTTESSIMRIGKKTTDVELFNVNAPLQEEEPPFPVSYVPKAKPLNESQESTPQTPISGQVIRLRGGSGPRSGYLEVQGAKPGWGVVCDSRNGWTLKEAHVVCRQLGYSRGAEMAWQGRNNRKGMPTWIAANSVACLGNETRFQSCKFTHNQECRTERDAVGVSCLPNRVAHCRKDEISHEGQCYHLAKAESGMNHAKALEYCTRRMARLIDITSQAENNFVSEWLLQTHPEVDSIMTSGVGFTTLSRTIWLWEDSSRAKFTFTKWWPGWLNEKQRPPQVNKTPTCIVMKQKYPCHDGSKEPVCVGDYFFWDVEDCSHFSEGQAFICKRPYDDIGCVYGKGNQYIGKANVTSSGKECLSWADERVAHPLNVNVVNREVREKLKTHNYCRNPNPHKESRPWCFTGLFGEREHCDIPSCGKTASQRSLQAGQCEDRHFECMPGQCIPSIWVCDGAEDCTNGADEKACSAHLSLFKKSARQILEGYDVEKWLHTPLKTCAHRCKVADFTCRSFAHNANNNICLLSDKNVGMTGALKPTKEFDYYELIERSMNCDGMFVCNNRKCINLTQVCNGKNDCNDRSDESICTVGNLDYAIRLAGSNNSHEGRVEVKVLGHWGQVCDDGFGMINADVICKELGFGLGALEVRTGGFYGNMDPPDRFMVDQLRCRGNETSMRECDFEGWGVHNCQPEEAVGVVCKTAVDSCQQGHWKCDNSPACIPTLFICDEVDDCPDGSDENAAHCDAPFEVRLANGSSPLEGRVEVRHHGVWGTVCDDDFTNTAARVICRSLGYGGMAVAKKNGYFGPGQGPIWLDEVFCHGNESQLYRCDHSHWGQHNCDHNEDAGVICKPGDVNDSEFTWEAAPDLPEVSINDLLPAECGKRAENFNDDEDFIFAKVVHGSVAPKGTYPWQASIRVRGHSRSSHWCGAVILSPLHVLTAAHCLEGYNKGTYFVRAGDYNTEIDEGTEAEANIEDYYVHNEFRKGHRMNNDIALVLLKGRGIPLGRHIMPICLPAENAEYPAGLNCTISGFGSIETGKSTQSRDLRYGWIPLLDQSVCRAGYVYGDGAISDGMVCAGHLDEGADTCDGDSGGPLACYHNGAFTLYGITSWGQHCGKANKPGVYTRVAYYRKWIDQKIRESLAGR